MSDPKPGDVAVIEIGCWANRHVGTFFNDGWSYGDGQWVADDPAIVTVILPITGRPKEPMGIGAVVADADGNLYVRAGSNPDGIPWHHVGGTAANTWCDINAVRVLSEGVQP